MKKRIVLVILVLLLTLAVAAPAFADSNPPAWGEVMGDWASDKKIMMGFYMPWFVGQGQGWRLGPTIGYRQGNCPACNLQ